MGAVRAECALQRPLDPKHPKWGTVRDGLESDEKAGMGRDPMLDSVKVPKGSEWLWNLFWQLRQGAAQGFSGASLTWADLEAYGRLSGIPLRGFVVEAVMAMDGALRAASSGDEARG